MPIVPDPILNKIRCCHCRNWISCGPVLVLASGKSLCGRCRAYKANNNEDYRHYAYEALASYFKFSCKNWSSHCSESLSFKRVLEHEKKCSYGSSCGFCCRHPCIALSSKRYLNRNGDVKLEMTPDEVVQYLRCGVCAGYLSSTPVYVCRDGTSICHRCSDHILQSQKNPEFIRDLIFETLADMMIFPCIFRYRGCAKYYKFGEKIEQHEDDCMYGMPPTQNIVQETYVPLKDDSESNNRKSELVQQKPDQRNEPLKKERGVIKTHWGHIYATITPNAPMFAPKQLKKQEYDNMFYDEFQKHRENLESRWGNPQFNGASNQPTMEDGMMGSLISELMMKQMQRKTRPSVQNGHVRNSMPPQRY